MDKIWAGIKRLSLESWQLYEYKRKTLLSSYPELFETSPIFNKDGQYWDRHTKSYWFEIGGKAYFRLKDGKQFLFSLEHLNHRRLRQSEIEAIETLLKARICPKELRDSYRREIHLMDLRSIKTGIYNHGNYRWR